MNNFIVNKSHWQAFISEKTELELLVISFMLKLNSKYHEIFPSQANIAMWVGCSRKTINKILAKFDQEKLIEKIYRHRKSCIYKLSTKFNLISEFPEARKKLPALVNYGFKLILDFFNGPGLKLLVPKVTPYKEENNSNYSSSVSESKESYSLGGQIDKILNKTIKKEEKRMESKSSLKISSTMKEIRHALNLTLWGQIRLIIYAEQALQETLQKYKEGISAKDHFLWFETYCHGISIKNNMPIQLELYETMKKRYKMPDNANWVNSSKIYQKTETYSPKNASIIPSERASSIISKYEKADSFWGQFIPEDMRK